VNTHYEELRIEVSDPTAVENSHRYLINVPVGSRWPNPSLVDGTLEECIREFMVKSIGPRHL
jgi:hypothetical protein